MALYKLVDGVRIEMTPEEEQAVRDEWAANEARVVTDRFITQINPILRAIVQEIAASTGRTEAAVLVSLRTRYLANGGE